MNDLCRRYQESYGENALSEEFLQHGASCEVCRDFVQSQKSLQQILPSWTTPQFSPDFALAVISRLAEDHSQARTLQQIVRDLLQIRISIPLPIGALAGFLFMISIILNFLSWPLTSPENRNASIQIAENQGGEILPGNTLIADPPEIQTPAAIPATHESKAMNGPLIVPREFLGAGAFLLVPILDPGMSFGTESKNQNQKTKQNHGI